MARGTMARWTDGLGAAWIFACGPLVALAPRGLPIWAILTTLTALAGLVGDGAARIGPGRAHPAGVAVALALFAGASAAWSPSPRAVPTVLEIGYIILGALAVGRWIATRPPEVAVRLARMYLAGIVTGLVLFSAEMALDFPVHHWANGIPADVNVMVGNLLKRSAGAFALLIWPTAILLHLRSGRAAGFGLLIAFSAATVVYTSRSAQLGMAAGLAVLALALWSGSAARAVLGGALAAAFAGAVPLALLLKETFHLDEAEWLFPSARHRVEIWWHAARRVLDAPLFGHGIDASRALPPRPDEWTRFGELRDTLLPLHPHNAFLQIWLELGAVGVALILALALWALGATRRLAPDARPYALALFASGLAMAGTAYGLWQAWWMAAYLAAGLMTALAAGPPIAQPRP